jgi:hypothetical protein
VGLPGNTSGKSALLKLQLLAHFFHELAAFVRSFFLQLTERDQGALGFRILAQTSIDTTQLVVSLGQVGLIADSYLQFSGGGLQLVRARQELAQLIVRRGGVGFQPDGFCKSLPRLEWD